MVERVAIEAIQVKAEMDISKLIEQVRRFRTARAPLVPQSFPSLSRPSAPAIALLRRARDPRHPQKNRGNRSRPNGFGGDFNGAKLLNLKTGRPWPVHMEILVNTIPYVQPAAGATTSLEEN